MDPLVRQLINELPTELIIRCAEKGFEEMREELEKAEPVNE